MANVAPFSICYAPEVKARWCFSYISFTLFSAFIFLRLLIMSCIGCDTRSNCSTSHRIERFLDNYDVVMYFVCFYGDLSDKAVKICFVKIPILSPGHYFYHFAIQVNVLSVFKNWLIVICVLDSMRSPYPGDLRACE